MNKMLRSVRNRTAEELLISYDIHPYPNSKNIDIDAIYDKLGISILCRNFSQLEKDVNIQNIEGVVLCDEERITFLVSDALSRHERRYVAAYLLGYCCEGLVSDEDGKSIYIKSKDNDMTESDKKAEQFALELLMPYKSLAAVTSKLLRPDLSALIQIFDVTYKEMVRRLDLLKIAYYKDVFC